jgi:hypothetical protein
MTWLNSAYTMQQAIAQGADVWELWIDNWGNITDPSADGSSLSFPAVGRKGLPSAAAIAIGPLSLVDRCAVGYALPNTLWADQGYAARWCTVDSPLLYTQPSNGGIVQAFPPMQATPNENGSIIVSTNDGFFSPVDDTYVPGLMSTLFIEQYLKADGSGPFTFGRNADPIGTVWCPPVLQLLFYLKPPAVAPPRIRAPFYYNATVPMSTGLGAEKLAFQIPTYGRKNIVVELKAVDAASYRIAAIPTLLSTGVAQEVTLASGGPLVANAKVRVPLTDVKSDYLMIYYTVAGAAPGTNFQTWVQAFD